MNKIKKCKRFLLRISISYDILLVEKICWDIACMQTFAVEKGWIMSLKKIAEAAGTSVSTVSRVLNNPEYHCQKEGLEEMIWELAKEYHYLPNQAARQLRTGVVDKDDVEKLTVDILLARFDSLKEDAFFQELFQILKEELLLQGCYLGEIITTMDIWSLQHNSENHKPVPYKTHQRVMEEKSENNFSLITRKKGTGLLIFGKCPRELIPMLKKRYAYMAGIDRNPTDYEYDEVICNGTSAAECAMEYLIKLGHKKIAYIGDCTFESRYIGYYQSLLNYKIPLNHSNIYPTRQTRKEGYEAAISIISSDERPTAIFCANDETAIGVLDAFKKKHVKGYIPSVISIDNIRESQKTSPLLTTIDIPKQEMVHLAMKLLIDRQEGYHTEAVRVELPCRLIIRDSCTYCV